MPIPRVDLFIDGSWVDVSSYVLYEAGIECSRGRSSESGSMEPQTASLVFNNTDYRFTPKHPLSPYFDKLQRNTPIRITNDAANVDDTETSYLLLPGVQAAHAHMADTSGISITGDLEIRLDIALDDWAKHQRLAGKYRIDINDRSWALVINADGTLSYTWSNDGSAITTVTSTASVGLNPGDRKTITLTHDVNNGAAGNDVKFYTADAIGGPYTQLGSTITTAGTTSIYNSLADLVVGDTTAWIEDVPPMTGKVYGFRLFQGIVGSGGTIKADPDFTILDEQTDSFTDAQGNTWFIDGAAQIVKTTPGPWRFYGEVSEWPVVSDVTGRWVTVSIEASGQWRRISQNEQPLNSVVFRAHTHPSLTKVKAYWSLEDRAESTFAASDYTGVGYPMTVTGGVSTTFEDYDSWTASAPMVTVGSAMFHGNVFPYTATGESGCYFFFITNTADAPAAECSLFEVRTVGDGTSSKIGYFDIRLLTNGNIRIKAYDGTFSAIDDGAGNLDAELGMAVFGRGFLIMHLELFQNGADTQWYIAVNDFTNTDVASGGIHASYFTGTISGKTFTRITSVRINSGQVSLPGTHISHLVVADTFKLTLTDVGDAINAYNGENPSSRLLRLCGEENIPIDLASQNVIGNSVTCGDQLIKTLSEILEETADTDLGILHESRDRLALRYRTRLSMANQSAAVTLSHSSHELGETLLPIDDDQLTVNEQFVIRDKGIKAFKAKTSGKIKNTSPLVDGVGRYSAEKTINVTYDQQVEDQVGFRLFLGTRDQPRYPKIVVNLHHPSIANDASLLANLLAVDIGDRIVVTDLPAYLPPDDISVIVNGYTERFDQKTHTITFNCLPEEPWQWAVADDTNKRADTDGSTTTASFVSGTDTSMTVTTPSGPLWTTKAASLPFNIRVSGVVLTVTAVSGSSNPQTLTITQTPVNGVAKTIPSGSAVNVANPAYVGLV